MPNTPFRMKAIAVGLLLVSCAPGCHESTSVTNVLAESVTVRDSVEYTGDLIRRGESLVVSVALTNRSSTRRIVSTGECGVTLMLLGGTDQSQIIWDQREGLACPDVESHYQVEAGEQVVLTRVITVSDIRKDVRSVGSRSYSVAARVATADDGAPPVILVGTVTL
jgi:hypothetical protein